jgi:hypothetical protein
VSCGEDTTDSYKIRVESQDVVLGAVDEIELVIRPETPHRFVADSFQPVSNAESMTFVSGAGEFVLRVKEPWIREHVVDAMGIFSVDVPLFPPSDDTSNVPMPLVLVSFLSDEIRIADGSILVPWPLPVGGMEVVRVFCKGAVFLPECQDDR